MNVYVDSSSFHSRGFAPADLRDLLKTPPLAPLTERLRGWLRGLFLLVFVLVLAGSAFAMTKPTGFILRGVVSRTISADRYSMGPALQFITEDPSIRQRLSELADKKIDVVISEVK